MTLTFRWWRVTSTTTPAGRNWYVCHRVLYEYVEIDAVCVGVCAADAD